MRRSMVDMTVEGFRKALAFASQHRSRAFRDGFIYCLTHPGQAPEEKPPELGAGNDEEFFLGMEAAQEIMDGEIVAFAIGAEEEETENEITLDCAPKFSQEISDRFISFLQEGKTFREAARRTGVSRISVYAWLKRGRWELAGPYRDFWRAVREARRN
ncbi:MAG: helix-turn-helix domain-containing protein [Candidatus Omnitrophota bacterium]